MKTCYELFGIECGPGWKPLYDPLIKICLKENVPILQIKEKFGTLRFYTGPAPQYIYDLIDDAERQSEVTCEICGKPGTLDTSGWWVVRCTECREE